MKMKRIFSALSATLFAALFFSCSPEQLKESDAVTLEENITIPYSAAEHSITYKSSLISVPKAKSDCDWLHSIDCSTKGQVTFSVDDNLGKGARTANLILEFNENVTKIVSVRQLTLADLGISYIKVNSETVHNVPSVGGNIEIDFSIENHVEGNEVYIESECDWLKSFSKLDNGHIAVNVYANFDGNSRRGTFKLCYPQAEPVEFTVIQAGTTVGRSSFMIYIDKVTETEAEIYWFPEDQNMTYINGINFKENLDKYSGRENEYIIDEINNLKAEAKAKNIEYKEYVKQFVQKGDKGIKRTQLEPGRAYCAYAYGVNEDGEPVTPLTVERFSTRSVDMIDCSFSFKANSITSESLVATITPSKSDVRYYCGIMPKREYDSYGSDAALQEAVRKAIDEEIWFTEWYSGRKLYWSDFTKIGEASIEKFELYSDTEYYIYAFGLEDQGLITTPLYKYSVRTPALKVTDNCTFKVTTTIRNSYAADFDIVPSNPDTYYYMEIIYTSYAVNFPLSDMATLMIADHKKYEEDWTQFCRSGRQYINTIDDLLMMPLEPETNYSLYIFGVDEKGGRTTEVSVTQFRTGSLQPSKLEMELGVTNVQKGSVNLTCVPSNTNEFFVLGCVPVDRFNEYENDNAFINAVVEYWSNSTMAYVLRRGEINENVTKDIFYNDLVAETEYYVFSFGYMGAVTTGLSKVRFSTAADVFSRATAELKCTLYDGSQLAFQNPALYPEDEYNNFAVFHFDIKPDKNTCQNWYFLTFTDDINTVKRLSFEKLMEYMTKYGSYSRESSEVKVPYYQSRTAVLVPVDQFGDYGRPVIKSYYADPNMVGAEIGVE